MANPLVENILLFKRLSQYTAEQIFQVIHDETPQTTAIILSRLEPKKAKDILEFFPSDDLKDIAYRMATAKSVPPEILNEVANTLGEKLRVFEPGGKSAEHIGMSGQDKMAEVLKHMGSSQSKELLDRLGKKDVGMSDRINRKMFLFEDIVKTESESLKRSLMSVDTSKLAVALKGTSVDMVKAVLEGLTANRQKMLASELKHLGPQLKSDVERARADIIATLRGFLDQGILRLRGDQSADEWV